MSMLERICGIYNKKQLNNSNNISNGGFSLSYTTKEKGNTNIEYWNRSRLQGDLVKSRSKFYSTRNQVVEKGGILC